MIRRWGFLALLILLLIAGACTRNTSPTPTTAAGDDRQAIEAALMKYLGERGTINLAAMNVTIEDLKIAGDRADAQVMFRTKQGEGEMRIAYVLLRQQGMWTVQAQPRADMPHPGIAAPQGATEMPAGHPPVSTPTQTPPSPTRKP